MRETRNAYKFLARKCEKKRPLGKTWHTTMGNTKIDLTEIGCVNMDWIQLAQDNGQWQALVNTVM
jgi:hypothetical protein